MTGSLIRAGWLAAMIAVAPALAQDSFVPTESGGEEVARTVSPERLAAGVREYPARVLRALLQLAEDPLVLRQLADEPELLQRPQEISPPVAPGMQAAIRELSVMPVIAAVAADFPAELKALQVLYAAEPQRMEATIVRLRGAYDRAALGAAVAWQEALRQNPAALEEYSKLVTRFCEAQREAYEGFPYVKVLERDYYYACPPNEAIILYAIENAESPEAARVIEQWWATYAPYELDARILAGDQQQSELTIGPDTVAAMPPEQRASMWTLNEADRTGSANLVPVIMQPPADQPPEAYYARAVAEHARLWTPEIPFETSEEAPAMAFDGPVETSIVGDEREYTPIDAWPYLEEPAEEIVYDDTGYWGPSYGQGYSPAAYSGIGYTAYHDHYAPIAVYYSGYPFDWPMFHGCDPGWLVRFRICSTYRRFGRGFGQYHRCRSGPGVSVCFGYGGRSGYHYGHSRRSGVHGVVRVGTRHYSRYSRGQVGRALHHRRTYHGRTSISPRIRTGYARSGTRSGWNFRPPASSARRSHRTGRAAMTRGTSSRPRMVMPYRGPGSGRTGRIASRPPTSARPRIGVTPRRSGNARSGTRVSPRPRTHSRPTGLTPPLGRTTPRRSSIVSPRRSTSPRPTTVAPPRRSSIPRRSPSVSPRSGSGLRPRALAPPRRGSIPRRSPSVSPRPVTGARSTTLRPPRRSGSPRRSPSVSPRSRSGSRPRTLAPARRGSSAPRRSPSVSPRPRSSSRPRILAPSRRGSSAPRRSPSVSPRSRLGSRPRSVASPRQSSAARRSPTVSSRRSPSPRSRSAVTPRRSVSPRRSPSVSPRQRTSSRPRSVATPRRSSSSHRAPARASRRR